MTGSPPVACSVEGEVVLLPGADGAVAFEDAVAFEGAPVQHLFESG